MKVLLIEDNKALNQAMSDFLKKNSINITSTMYGEEAIELLGIYTFDIIILDLVLPDIHGLDVLKDLRNKNIHSPVLILSEVKDTESKIRGLNLGADDYLIKPFHSKELLSRMNAIVRRSKGHSNSVITLGRLMINVTAKSVFISDEEIDLTAKEYSILEQMAYRVGSTLSKEFFLDHLYGGIDEPEPKIIDVFICKIRKKLAVASGGLNYIQTVWGRGYLLKNPEE